VSHSAVLFSPAFIEAHGDLAIATIDVRSIDRNKLASRIDEVAEFRLATAASSEGRIMEHVEMYELFFKQFGVVSPLRRQLKTTRTKGLPDIDPVVRLLLLAEMTTGVLMGVHDTDSIRGAITFDIAAQGESFEGMRTEVQCGRGEIVARDDLGIIFSYFQGADRRTCGGAQTNSVVYFAFGVRSLPNNSLLAALSVVAEVVGETAALGSPALHAATRLGES
jgi:DNA/RNA-binding domain of Phe-tRNA-synthetase-like protein